MRFFKILFLLSAFLVVTFKVNGQGENIIIKGTVTSKASGETLIGATVAEVNNEDRIINGATTDINGQFVLKIKSPNNKINISSIGFKKQTVVPGSSRVFNIQLEEEAIELGTVIVKGKQVKQSGGISIPTREIANAVQTVSTKDFEGVQVTSVDDALQGRIAGMDIVSNSGDPGSGATIRIRGASSMNANNPPLIVVNGIPRETTIDAGFNFASANQEQYANLLSLNPDDMEEITVMKDAASTAIWGSRGANGVIEIKTKKGVKGPTNIQYTYRLTQNIQPKGMNMLNGDDYTMMMKQAKFNPHLNSNASNVREYNYDKSFSEYEEYNNNTDWVKEVIQKGYIHDHYVTVSGGGERANYIVSGGFLNQTGTIIGQKLSRVTARAELDYRVSNRLKFVSEFSFTYSDNYRNWQSNSSAIDKMSILDIAYNKMPNLSVYAQDSLGNNTDRYYNIRTDAGIENSQKELKNPLALARLATNNLKNFRIVPTLRFMYDILDPEISNLKYQMYVSFDINTDKTNMYLPREATNLPADDVGINRAESSDIENIQIQTENNINWEPRFTNRDHSLIIFSAFQTWSSVSTPLGITSYGYPSSNITDASAEGTISALGSQPSQGRTMAILGRAHYAYKGRYILDGIIRRDGSSKYGSNHRYGNFPGISAKWIISDEPFMQNTNSWLNMLAFRPSWGVSGNQPKYEYLYQSKYATYGNYSGVSAVIPTGPELSKLQWERSSSYNLGMDIELFQRKWVFDINYYYKLTDQLLVEKIPLPSSSGFNELAYKNAGAIKNQGWEMNVFGNEIIKKGDFTVNLNFNISNNKNVLLSLDQAILNSKQSKFDPNVGNGVYLSYLQNGNSFGSIYGFRYKGVYQYNDYIPGVQEDAPVARDKDGNVLKNGDKYVPMVYAYGEGTDTDPALYTFKGGDAKYEDINHDGNIDKLDIVYLGNSNPKINGGFMLSASYKRFMVSAFFNYRYGNKIVNYARMLAENMYGDNNQSIAVNYRWRKDGDITQIPRALFQYGYNWLGSDRYVEDGSFLRFKELTFRYTASKSLVKKAGISKIDFYLTLNNLYVFTKYTGVDPEVGYGDWGVSTDKSKTPRSKGFTFGVTVGI